MLTTLYLTDITVIDIRLTPRMAYYGYGTNSSVLKRRNHCWNLLKFRNHWTIALYAIFFRHSMCCELMIGCIYIKILKYILTDHKIGFALLCATITFPAFKLVWNGRHEGETVFTRQIGLAVSCGSRSPDSITRDNEQLNRRLRQHAMAWRKPCASLALCSWAIWSISWRMTPSVTASFFSGPSTAAVAPWSSLRRAVGSLRSSPCDVISGAKSTSLFVARRRRADDD